ncbi:hypothetical protein Rs2_48932 [Raphanus sativus]|nr:hypothetical protein Rs2_48932 [Raphanus sativus]
MDPVESVEYNALETTNTTDHGWKKVVYPKRNRKQKPSDHQMTAANGNHAPNGDSNNVFRSLEERAEDRHRRILAAKKAADDSDGSDPARSKLRSDGYGYEDEAEDEKKQKVKVKKEKKPKVSLAEAAAKIDAENFAAFLFEASESYGSQPEIQLMRFADYFGRALSGVSSSHFPWVKTFKESPLSKLVDVKDPVFKSTIQRPHYVCLSLISLKICVKHQPIGSTNGPLRRLEYLALQQGGAKGGKKGGAQHATSKSQVAIFVTLAMVLRKKPDALTNVLPTVRENPKYQGQDKFPVIVWMMAQASQGDLSAGLLSWAHNLLPVVSSKSCNPQSRDLILQLVERILSNPKARAILVSGPVRKGERLIPPPSFEILMRLTFPHHPQE